MIARDKLLGSIMQVMIDHELLPASIPFVPFVTSGGDVTDIVVKWARENPDKAEQVVNEVYDLMNQYKGGD